MLGLQAMSHALFYDAAACALTVKAGTRSLDSDHAGKETGTKLRTHVEFGELVAETIILDEDHLRIGVVVSHHGRLRRRSTGERAWQGFVRPSVIQ